jgi:hypothetical protein
VSDTGSPEPLVIFVTIFLCFRYCSQDLELLSKSKRLFRSYKNFDNENFIKDLNELNLDFSNFSDVNLAYENFDHQFTQVYDNYVMHITYAAVKITYFTT